MQNEMKFLEKRNLAEKNMEEVPELLSLILHLVDPATLFTSQVVCSQWRNIIQTIFRSQSPNYQIGCSSPFTKMVKAKHKKQREDGPPRRHCNNTTNIKDPNFTKQNMKRS